MKFENRAGQKTTKLEIFLFTTGCQIGDVKARLLASVKAGNVEEVEKIIDCPEVDVNARDAGKPLLHWAASNGGLEVVEALLNTSDVEINARNPIQ